MTTPEHQPSDKSVPAPQGASILFSLACICLFILIGAVAISYLASLS